MSEPVVIDTPSGDQLVVLLRADYEALRARLAEYEDAEDAADAVTGAEAMAQREAQGRPAYPLPVVRLMREGCSPLQAFRRHFGITRKALAKQVGITQKALGEFEQSRLVPDTKTLAALAAALGTNEASLQPLDR